MMLTPQLLMALVRHQTAFEESDKEYVAALLRKIDWQEQEMRDVDPQMGCMSYPHDYEIQQWELKRELAQRDLSQTVSKIKKVLQES